MSFANQLKILSPLKARLWTSKPVQPHLLLYSSRE
jgi:hypothetical protein